MRMKDYARSQHGDRPLVARLGGLAALLDRNRGERGGEPGREPQREPHPHADLPGARLARAPGIGELVGAGRAGARGRPGDRARARPALLRLALGAERERTGARSAPPAPCASPRPRRPEDAEALREHAAAFIAEKFPAPAGPDPSTVGGAVEYEGAAGALREAYGRETAAAYGGWSAVREGSGAGCAGRRNRVRSRRPHSARARRPEDRHDGEGGRARGAQPGSTREDAREGRAGVAVGDGQALRAPRDGEPAGCRRLARRQALRHREERRARRRTGRGRQGPAADRKPGSASGPGGLGGLLSMIRAAGRDQRRSSSWSSRSSSSRRYA